MRRMPSLVWLLAALTGCTGTIGAGNEDDGVITPPGTDPQSCTSTASPGAPVPMRRLTAVQVMRTVDEVLGVQVELDVSDERLFAFRSNISSSVDFVAARGYLDFAEAAVAASDLSPCVEAGEACTTWLLDDVAERLFRRPLVDEERARYQTAFDAGALEDGPETGARWALEAMLQSPTLLYLDEVVDEDGYLDSYSMASRLALTLWGSNPDAELLDKARLGELATADQIRAAAETMLADPRSAGGLTDFVDQWLRLERLNDPDARPDLEALGAETLTALRAEPVQLMRMLVEEGADLDTLLTTPETVKSELLADLYAGDILETSGNKTTLDPARRAGILAMPGVMAALSHAGATSPTLRGYNILSNFLCTPPPPPPAGVNVTLPDIGPGKTTRERLEAHFNDPVCASCHGPMDGMGFAFEGIDWLGRSRDTEFDKPIDDTSEFPLDGEKVTVDGPDGLATVMANSPSVASCVVRQWASYGGGIPDKKEAACLVEHLAEDAQKPGGLRAMILGFVISDWYRRGPEEAQ
ncbi:MAG: DUF1592 domain-containing protein [Polyangiaceae bacterium]